MKIIERGVGDDHLDVWINIVSCVAAISAMLLILAIAGGI